MVYGAIMTALNDAKRLKVSIDVSGYSGSLFCGAAGCDFALYEKEGKMTIAMVDHWEIIN